MLFLFLLSSLLFSAVSAGRSYPNKCETCNEMVSYILEEFVTAPSLTKEIMQALEVYCYHHVGGAEATCSDFTNMIRKGNLFEILWRATKVCRGAMSKIDTENRKAKLLWGCPSAPDCVCLNLQQCEGIKQKSVVRSNHADCIDIDSYILEEFSDVFKMIQYTNYDANIL